MSESVECLTLDFGLGHDLRVVRLSPECGSMLSLESAGDSLFHFPSAPSPTLSLFPSLKKWINLLKNYVTFFSECGYIQAWVNALFMFPHTIRAQLCFCGYFLSLTSFMSLLPTPPVSFESLSADRCSAVPSRSTRLVAKLSFSPGQVFTRVSRICRWLYCFHRHPGLLRICCRWRGEEKVRILIRVSFLLLSTKLP